MSRYEPTGRPPGRPPKPRTTPEPAPIPGARWIPLTQGLFALVDEADWALVAPFLWHAARRRTRVYAGTNSGALLMHRLLLGCDEVDHIDGDGLDNRRSNLRACTDSQNNFNQRVRTYSASGFKGVTLDRRYGRWIAQIQANKRHYTLGTHATAEEAARVYDAAALRLHGDFARLNFPHAASVVS